MCKTKVEQNTAQLINPETTPTGKTGRTKKHPHDKTRQNRIRDIRPSRHDKTSAMPPLKPNVYTAPEEPKQAHLNRTQDRNQRH